MGTSGRKAWPCITALRATLTSVARGLSDLVAPGRPRREGSPRAHHRSGHEEARRGPGSRLGQSCGLRKPLRLLQDWTIGERLRPAI
jgi:hypothetical protein